MNKDHARLLYATSAALVVGLIAGWVIGYNVYSPKIEALTTQSAKATADLNDMTNEYAALYPKYSALVESWNSQQQEIATGNYEYFGSVTNYAVSGSTCNDGYHSPSVGSGTCSWHDGVRSSP